MGTWGLELRVLRECMGFGFGKRNVEGEMILEFADAWNFVVANTWFEKNEGRPITYEIPGKCRTVIDYILIRKSERKLIRDVKVIWHEQCIPNHKLIICALDLKKGLNKRKMAFRKRCKVWKLRDDVTAGIFKERVQTRAALVVEKPAGVEDVWKNFKECLIEDSVEVCGETRGMRRYKESWWWNEKIAALVKEKQHLFKLLAPRTTSPGQYPLDNIPWTIPPEQYPLGQIPPGQYPPWIIAPWTISPGQCEVRVRVWVRAYYAGGYCPGGYYPGGILSGGYCPQNECYNEVPVYYLDHSRVRF